jgi:hypothetical protein
MTAIRTILALGLTAALYLAGPAAAQKEDKPIDKVGDTAEKIVEKPLKDLNLIKDEIPPKLLEVMNAPYSTAGLKTCAEFKSEIDKLTAVLGPDVDAVKKKAGESAAETMLGAAQSVAGGLIPGSGLIRKLSGAEKAEEKAKAAVLAGSLRRAYLKGSARAKGCKI